MRVIDTLIRRSLFHQRRRPWLIRQAAWHIEAGTGIRRYSVSAGPARNSSRAGASYGNGAVSEGERSEGRPGSGPAGESVRGADGPDASGFPPTTPSVFP